jgi:hypothetical protein
MGDELVQQAAPGRAEFVKNRLLEINKHANSLIIESGTLLSEYKANGYHREDGFKSFDEAIEAYHASGLLDYGARQARYLIAVVQMVTQLGIPAEDVEKLGVSRLREIASAPGEASQRQLLEAAKNMSVSDVQKEARKLRDKAMGRESDPFEPYMIKTTESQRAFLKECLTEARRIYSLDEGVSDAVVLIDVLLTGWFNTRPQHEAEQVEATIS